MLACYKNPIPFIVLSPLSKEFRVCGRGQRALRSPSALLRGTLSVVAEGSLSQYHQIHLPHPPSGGVRRFPKGDLKALWSRPQARTPAPQAVRRGAPVARRDPCKGTHPSQNTRLGVERAEGPSQGPGAAPLAGCQGSALTGSPEGSALWHLGYSTFFPQQFLYFLPLPQGQGSLRPTFSEAFTLRGSRGASLATRASTGLAACTRSGVRSTRAW